MTQVRFIELRQLNQLSIIEYFKLQHPHQVQKYITSPMWLLRTPPPSAEVHHLPLEHPHQAQLPPVNKVR